jgi:DNA repair exonuclease SbcCD nuclease subunit
VSSVCILHLADVHLDTPFTWAGHGQGRARRQAIRDALRAAFTLAVAERVDAVTIAGDLYEHERASDDTGQFLADLAASIAPIPVLLAPGNHDWYGPSSLYARTTWPANVHVFTTARLTPYPLADGFTLWGAAHTSPANTPGFLDGFTVDGDGIHIGVFHGAERAALPREGVEKLPHAPFHASQIRTAGLHHALVGHLHTPEDADHFTYPGNPEPLTFGETGPRAAVLITVDEDGHVTRDRRTVSQTAVHDITVDITGLTHTEQVRTAVADATAGATGVVRITVTGEVDPRLDVAPDRWKPDLPGMSALVLRVEGLRPALDLDAIATEQTVRGQFVRDVMAAGLDPDMQRRVLGTGLRALAGDTELEVR